jgi:uncharacterized protein (TIGR02246 family)
VTKSSLACCLSALVIVACNTSREQPLTEKDTAAIDRVRADYLAGWKSGLADRVATIYTNDAVAMYPNQPTISGNAAIRDYFQHLFAQFAPGNFEIMSDEVIIASNWAIDRGRYKLTLTPRAGGPAINDEGKYLVVYQRQTDGSYKVARDIDNSSMPLAPGSEASKKQH